MKTKEYSYKPLKNNLIEIEEIVKKGRFRSVDAFIDNALQMIISWEKDPIKVMSQIDFSKFTPEQKRVLATFWKDEKVKEYIPEHYDSEQASVVSLGKRDDHHIELRKNMMETKEYIMKLKFQPPRNKITYDGHPILFYFYSRILPAKIVLAVLADMLRESKGLSVRLDELRPRAFDIAQEFSGKLSKLEEGKTREKLISTGLPKEKKAYNEEDDITKKAGVRKRFCDQFVGKIRKDKETGVEHLEGILSALGFIETFTEDDKDRVYMTENGIKFYLLENPVLNEDNPPTSLSHDECNFIFDEVVPKLKLENEFIKVALKTVKLHDGSKNPSEITNILNEEFLKKHKEFVAKHPKLVEDFRLNHLKSLRDKDTKNKIVAWRVATMGRLTELQKVKWTIRKNESEYQIV